MPGRVASNAHQVSLARATSCPVTTTSFRFSPLGQIHMVFSDAHMTPGSGAHRLVFPVKVTGTWLDPDGPTSIAAALLVGTVWTGQPYFRWLAGLEPQVVTLRRFPADEELVVSMSDDQLIALERARGEDDVVLIVKLQATLLSAHEGVHSIGPQNATLRISRTRWLDQLDQVGSEVGILLRVPSPLTDSPTELPPAASAEDAASLAQATARLRQARWELRDHQWEHCVATCRRVLENLAHLAEMPSATAVFKIAPEARTQAERWAALYYAAKSMASAAHHDDDITGGFGWNRADAEAVLATTAGLLVRYTTK